MQSNYFAIFNYFTQNSTYMKKGSFTSKLDSPFFIQSKFTLMWQSQLPNVWIHFYHLLPADLTAVSREFCRKKMNFLSFTGVIFGAKKSSE